MAQTTSTFPMSCGEVEISSDYTTWTDISGSVGKVQNTTQSKMSGEYYTLDGDTAIIEYGKRQPMEITFEIPYTEQAAEAWETARAEFEAADCGDALYVRWSPGGSIGENKFSTDENYSQIVSFDYPPLDATTAGPIICSFVVKTAKVDVAAATS